MWVSTGVDRDRGSTWGDASPIEQSAMYSGRDRGRGRDRDFWKNGSFEAGRSVTGDRQSTDKGPRHCKHCGQSNHISEKCWEKFDRPEWARLANSDSPIPDNTPHVASSTHTSSSGSSTVILTQEEYDRLRQLEFSHNSHSTTLASSSGMHAYTVSPKKCWILD